MAPEDRARFAHFNDDELADGIMAVHTIIDGWTRDEFVAALAYWRGRGEEIKRVWRIGLWDEQQQRTTALGQPRPDGLRSRRVIRTQDHLTSDGG